MKHLSKISLLFFLFWASSLFAQTDIIQYPNWFLYPAKYPNITTGFSSPDSTTKQNAAKMKAVFNSCIIKGELFLYEVTNDYDLNKYSNYYYYYSDSSANDYYNKFISVNKYIINTLNKEYIEAFTLNKYDTLSLNLNPQAPAWLNKSFYEQDGYYYSAGMYTSIGRDNDAWIASEERAMFNLLRNIYINIYGIKKNFDSQNDNEDAHENITAYKLNAKMNNIEIMERYPDTKQQLYYTLIRIKKRNIKII